MAGKGSPVFPTGASNTYSVAGVRLLHTERRRWGAAAGSVALAAVTMAVVAPVVSSGNLNWSTIVGYLLDQRILAGLWVTIEVATLAMLAGSVLGLFACAAWLSNSRLLSAFGRTYVWFFRSVPALVQVLFCYNLALFVPSIGGARTNEIISPFMAAVMGLTLNASGYLAEIFRSGFLSIPSGQFVAARSLGIRPERILWSIIAPQVFRVIAPPLVNLAALEVKGSAIVFAIALTDLFGAAKKIYSSTFEVIDLLVVVSFWYLALSVGLSILQKLAEQRLNRAYAQT